ncbi:hypothetical protein [Kitasatospora aureofaciens]|uniref:hypothetical protein n=1 Tax=Kitasatospora aureofaciens TaxID=1894 RepID=UPI0033FAE950
MDTTSYRTALGELTRERFATTPPQPYKAATGVVLLIADLLPARTYAAFLQAALDAHSDAKGPNRPVSWDFTDYLSRHAFRALGIGPDDDVPADAQEAWHLLRILPSLVPAADFGIFISCAQSALEQSGELLDA